MKRRNFLKTSALLAGSATLPNLAWSAQSSDAPLGYPLTHRVTDAKAPAVYFVPAVDGAALVRLYDALGQRRIGKVGIKMTFETPGGPHLDPKLVKALADHTKATLIENNCYPPRDTTQKHLEVARGNGFDESIAPIDILDSDGHMDLPVSKGYHLKFGTESRFRNFESELIVH